jgi:hypothetical protein
MTSSSAAPGSVEYKAMSSPARPGRRTSTIRSVAACQEPYHWPKVEATSTWTFSP